MLKTTPLEMDIANPLSSMVSCSGMPDASIRLHPGTGSNLNVSFVPRALVGLSALGSTSPQENE